ncbi:3-oxoacyl-ACP reductase FabG [Alcaligenaceae bacterium 429]|nr:3-oxoacyl-ACP reductase FabG [Alcaligenaceae bacterium 429]
MRSGKLAGKVVFVQGGARGIGAAIVRLAAAEGASVAFSYVQSTEKALALQESIRAAGGNAMALHADSADASAVEAVIMQTVQAWGNIDILVNNAGGLALGHIGELSIEDFDRSYAINVRSAFVASQIASQHMNDQGRIIHIGSVNAERVPFVGGAAYAMSKAALVGLTKAMARDLGDRGITVNNVQPGPVDTDLNPDGSEFSDELKKIMALKRYAKEEEIASFVMYLASPEAAFVTGASLSVDGGFTA